MAKRILVINDTQEILDLFRDLLSEEGYEVILQSYTVRELDRVREAKADLIILDYIIDGEAVGWQTLQKLKMTRDLSQVPVIICTAATERVKEIEGQLREKNVKVVSKPFDIDDLLGAVSEMLADSESDKAQHSMLQNGKVKKD